MNKLFPFAIWPNNKILTKSQIIRNQSFPKWQGSKIPLTDDERSAQIDLEGAVQAENARRDPVFRMRMAQAAFAEGKDPEGYFGLSSKDTNIGVPIQDHELPLHMRKDVIDPETHQWLLNPKTSPEARRFIIDRAIRQGTRDDMAMLRSPHTGLLPHYQAHINGTTSERT